MERTYVDGAGKDNKYVVSCFFDPTGDDDDDFDDDGRLVCNNFGFNYDGNSHMEVYWDDDDEDFYLLGTSSSASGIEAWSDECKLVK